MTIAKLEALRDRLLALVAAQPAPSLTPEQIAPTKQDGYDIL